jgi:uncharacterized protein (UPF0261 family)
MSAAVLVGTLDTKGRELKFLRDRLAAAGVETILVDVGIMGEPAVAADVSREDVALAAGSSLAELVRRGDRGEAVTAMARGAEAVVGRLHAEGRVGGVLALGGSAGATIASAAMRSLPVGIPKVIVSTVASGDTRPYVGAGDITMMYPIVDIAGLNKISTRIIANAAGAMAGMMSAPSVATPDKRPLIAATMFGVTTPCVSRAQSRLDELGYEVLVFHATGVGGDGMESLVADGYFDAVLDLTTTELADELAGGVCAAGPGRLDLAAEPGTPRVVSLGALDMVNFGPRGTVPDRYAERLFYQHNDAVTLMRTDVAECAALGERIAARLNRATAPVAVMIPRRGVSAIDAEDQPFFSPAADAALFDALLGGLDADVEAHDLPLHINDPEFADAAVEIVDRLARAAHRDRAPHEMSVRQPSQPEGTT